MGTLFFHPVLICGMEALPQLQTLKILGPGYLSLHHGSQGRDFPSWRDKLRRPEMTLLIGKRKTKFYLEGNPNKIIADFLSQTMEVRKKWVIFSKCSKKKEVDKESYIQQLSFRNGSKT